MDDRLLRMVVFTVEILLTGGLIAWIRSSTRGKPLHGGFIAVVLLSGAACALASAYVTNNFSFDLPHIQEVRPDVFNRFGALMVILNVVAGALVEELAKYAVGVFLMIDCRYIRRMTDIVALMIIIGLGFALVEDLLYFADPHTFAPYRLMSFYLHSGTSAIIGYSLARFRYGLAGYREIARAILAAITLHIAFNLATEIQDSRFSLALIISIALFISMQIFILMSRTLKEEYRLEKSSAVPRKPTKLLNLRAR